MAGLLDELVLGQDELLELGAIQRAVGDHRELVAHVRDAVAQVVRRPPGGGRRVVELVGEPGRELAQREQPFPLADHRRHVALAQEQPLQQVHGHRVPGAEHVAELARPHREERRVRRGAHGGDVDLLGLIAQVELHRTDVGAAVVGAVDLHLLGADLARHDQRALQKHVEALRAGCPRRPGPAGGHVDDVRVLAHPAQLGVVEVLEEEQSTQLVGRDPARGLGGVGNGHCSSRCRTTSRPTGVRCAHGRRHVIERRPPTGGPRLLLNQRGPGGVPRDAGRDVDL